MDSLSLRTEVLTLNANQEEVSEFEATVDRLWDVLRDQCCASRHEAKAIVLLSRADIARALRQIAAFQPH